MRTAGCQSGIRVGSLGGFRDSDGLAASIKEERSGKLKSLLRIYLLISGISFMAKA